MRREVWAFDPFFGERLRVLGVIEVWVGESGALLLGKVLKSLGISAVVVLHEGSRICTVTRGN